ncbi:MAG: chemotaxis protein CheW, partial [Gemmatimonadota bacterium]
MTEHVQLIGFEVGGDAFALPILDARRVLRYQEPVRDESLPPAIAGRIPFEGAEIPVIDLRTRLGRPAIITPETRTV